MKLLRTLGGEFVGLFLEDEFLAVAALIVVCTAAVLVKAIDIKPVVGGGVLLGGCVGVLLMSVRRTASSR